jgi:hypothetical protein
MHHLPEDGQFERYAFLHPEAQDLGIEGIDRSRSDGDIPLGRSTAFQRVRRLISLLGDLEEFTRLTRVGKQTSRDKGCQCCL